MTDAAKQIADSLWPINGDPTSPVSRSESEGWRKAYECATDGLRDAANGVSRSWADGGDCPESAYAYSPGLPRAAYLEGLYRGATAINRSAE